MFTQFKQKYFQLLYQICFKASLNTQLFTKYVYSLNPNSNLILNEHL